MLYSLKYPDRKPYLFYGLWEGKILFNPGYENWFRLRCRLLRQSLRKTGISSDGRRKRICQSS